jgi:hypothetical protein
MKQRRPEPLTLLEKKLASLPRVWTHAQKIAVLNGRGKQNRRGWRRVAAA